MLLDPSLPGDQTGGWDESGFFKQEHAKATTLDVDSLESNEFLLVMTIKEALSSSTVLGWWAFSLGRCLLIGCFID